MSYYHGSDFRFISKTENVTQRHADVKPCREVSDWHNPVARHIARLVLSELQRRDQTITWLASRTEIDRGSLSRWLSGERSISVDKAERCMQVLKIVPIATEALTDEHRTDRRTPRSFRQARQEFAS